MGRIVLLLIVAIIALSSIATLFTTAQLSEEEARQKFEALGCTSCHNGQVAKSWDETIQLFKSWKDKYADLDEAVSAEVKYFGGQTFNSYDEMMQVMAQNVGRSLEDPEFKALYDYYKSLFGEEPQETPTETEQPTETTPEETTPQQTTQETQVTTQETSPTPEPTTPSPPETQETPTEAPEQGIGFGVAAGIALLIIIVVLGAIFLLSRR